MKRIISILVILVLICTAMLLASCTQPKHNPVANKVVEPTCLSIGYTEYYCDHCKITYVADFVDALGHSYGEELVEKESDCTNRGIYKTSCERCNFESIRTVDAKGHSYLEISNDDVIVVYECEHCYHTLSIGVEEDISDYFGSVEVFDVETNYTFDIICKENEEYIKNHLTLIDSYFVGSEYEDRAMMSYNLTNVEGDLWRVSFDGGYEYDTTYLAKVTDAVRFADYKGIELFFTVKDDPNHENVQEYSSDVVFLHALQQQHGGYYPYSVSAKEGESRIYVTLNKIDGLSKGKVLCVGEITGISDLESGKECYFGIIDEFYEVADGKWVVTLGAPELQDIFENFDIAFNEEINLENANINVEQLKAELVDSLYSNKEFVEFLSVVNTSANSYLQANGYYSPSLENAESYLNAVQINPSVSFNNNKLKAKLNGSITLDIKNANGNDIGDLVVDFSFDIETKFKIDVNYEIRTSGFLGLNVTLDRFDIAITQSDKIGFDFGVSVDSSEMLGISYVRNKNSGEVHLACCIEVERAADTSIFESTTASAVKSAEKKCSHCHPTGSESAVDGFKSYYVSTLYCSDWAKVASDINKLTQTNGASATVKLTSVDIPLAMGVEIQLDLGFMLGLEPHALLDYSSTFTQTSTYGMRLNSNSLQPYSNTSGGSFTQDELAIVGQAQTKIGLSVDAFVSIQGCEKWFRAGVKADVGAYADISGVYDSSESYVGAYLEAGTFVDIAAYYKLFSASDSADMMGSTYPLLKYGYEKLYFGYDTYYDTISILGSYDIAANNLLKVRYYDLVNMVVKTGELSLNERSKYRVEITFADGRYCEIKNGVIVYKTGAPEVFSDTLIINVISNDNWNNYRKGSSVYYIGTYTVDFVFDTNHRHTWVDATCTEPKHCIGCGASEGSAIGHNEVVDKAIDPTCTQTGLTSGSHCSICGVVTKKQNTLSALGHYWKDATCQSPKTCNRCGTTQGTTIACVESNWIVDKQPNQTENGIKHTECLVCGRVIREEIIKATASVGLVFTLNSDKQSYSISGIGTCTDTEIIIPSEYNGLPVTKIGADAFIGNRTLEKISLPDTIVYIGEYAFSGCYALKEINFPSGLQQIWNYAFYFCKSLVNVDIPDSVTRLGCAAFFGCESLVNVKLGANVSILFNDIDSYGATKQTYGAFENCVSLKTVTINACYIEIQDETFYNCSSLEQIIFNGTIKEWQNAKRYNLWNYNTGNYTVYCTNGTITKTGTINQDLSIGIEYELNSDGKSYTVIGIGTCTDTEIIIPSEYNGFPVTNIGYEAFMNCTSLTSIEIPDSVTIIDDYAFSYCTKLTTVIIPNSVTKIETSLFQGCSSLTSITIPDSVTSIPGLTFYGCTSLTSITIPNSVTSIGKYAFESCTSLASITLSNSLTSIDDYAFMSCTSLTSITIPDSVMSIGYQAFSRCTLLSSITLSNSLMSIGDAAFMLCTSLTSVTIPDSIWKISESTFSGCTSLTSVTIPNSVTNIDDYAFSGCTSLKSINFEGTIEKWKKINKYVYWNDNTGQYTIYCTDGTITHDGIENKYASKGLVFTLNSDKKSYSVTGVGTCKDATIIVPREYNGLPVTSIGTATFSYCAFLKGVELPNTITHIGERAFYNSTALTNVVLSDSLTTIDDFAFAGCSALKEIFLPNSLTSIGEYAFSGCSSIRNITLPDSLTSIGNLAFRYCRYIKSIVIPKNVTQIGYAVFASCSSLEQIIVDVDNPNYMDIDGNVYSKDGSTLVLYANGKKDSTFIVPNSVTAIADTAFTYCENIETIILPESITTIGYGIFMDCTSLKNVNIPNSVTSIGDNAFAGCVSLTSIVIPNSVTSIGDYAFCDCTQLNTIVLSSSLTRIGYAAFYECQSLTTITIPVSLTSIGDEAFYRCGGISTINFLGTISQWYDWKTSMNAEYIFNCEPMVNCTDGQVK